MRYVALAASVATYWLLVACAHLMVHPVRPEPIIRAAQAAQPIVVPPVYVRRPEDSRPMSKLAFVRAMNAVKPKVARCYDLERVAGMAMVRILIAPSGKVASATVTGRFADTPTGTCVAQAVLTARFPATDYGFSTPFPFQLR